MVLLLASITCRPIWSPPTSISTTARWKACGTAVGRSSACSITPKPRQVLTIAVTCSKSFESLWDSRWQASPRSGTMPATEFQRRYIAMSAKSTATKRKREGPDWRLPDEGEPTWEIALLFPAQGTWTEDDYFALDGSYEGFPLVELSNGRLEALPMPTQTHQFDEAF